TASRAAFVELPTALARSRSGREATSRRRRGNATCDSRWMRTVMRSSELRKVMSERAAPHAAVEDAADARLQVGSHPSRWLAGSWRATIRACGHRSGGGQHPSLGV